MPDKTTIEDVLEKHRKKDEVAPYWITMKGAKDAAIEWASLQTPCKDYWKQRCEAAEAVIELSSPEKFIGESKDKATWDAWLKTKKTAHETWQQLKSSQKD